MTVRVAHSAPGNQRLDRQTVARASAREEVPGSTEQGAWRKPGVGNHTDRATETNYGRAKAWRSR